MKKFRLQIILFLTGVVFCVLTFNGVLQVEKLNFLIEPYFIIFMFGLFFIFLSIVTFLLKILVEFIYFLNRKK